jgi:hypothetical protein
MLEIALMSVENEIDDDIFVEGEHILHFDSATIFIDSSPNACSQVDFAMNSS